MSVCSLTMKLPATVLLLTWRMNWESILVSARASWRTSAEPFMGSLVINVTEADRERVTAWLTDRGILWGGA